MTDHWPLITDHCVFMLDRLVQSEPFVELIRHLRPSPPYPRVWGDGLWGSAAPMVCAAIAKTLSGDIPPPVLLVVAHLDQADDAVEDVELFLPDHEVALLPGWASKPDYSEASDEVAAERLSLCRRLTGTVPFSGSMEKGTVPLVAVPLVIVAPAQALQQPVPKRTALSRATLAIRAGQEISPDAIAAWLTDHGFARVELVDVPGDFAVRGGIVDVFPAGDRPPIRIDFFGDQIESIRTFDVDTQRSRPDTIDELELFGGLAHAPDGATDFDTCSFLDYLPDGALIAFNEPTEIEELGRAYIDRNDDPTGLYPIHTLLAPNPRLRQLFMAQFANTTETPLVAFGCQSLQRFETTPAEAVTELTRLADRQDVVVYCDNPAEKQRLAELIAEQHPDPLSRLSIKLGFLHTGFAFPAAGFALVGHHEVFHRYRTRHRVRRIQAGRPIDSFLDLQPNDYVVHVTHGIAKFTGTKMLTKAGRTEEYLTLRFANEAVLHVPANQIHLVQKYVGAFKGHPKLSTLGSKSWDNKKQQVSAAVMDLAAELLETQARRAAQPGVAYPGDTVMQKEFEDSFIYQETEDQLLTLRQIKKDLQSPRPMDRLLCGDVGYGKTELAIRAAFKVIQAGKQAAVLVPTTVLAEQHERTFRERFADYPVTIESISRFRTLKQAKGIVQRAASGHLDVLIGTHRLLSDDVTFRDLGLLVIDEEQRFGVEHKEKLKQVRATVEILTMTATPIPRTLHMSLLGLRDISSLATPPMDRRAIHTEAVQFNAQQIRAAVIRELNRDGQIYFVHNRVHNIQSVADRLKQIVPEARIIIGHGQMHGHELEKVMLKFVRHQADILVCTTIIESGVDIPNVNTIFIHEADMFGLAELHQLRGRVGRYKHKAYCYLMLPERRPVTPTAGRRLKAIEEYSELGAGFRIALRDLEIRGAGNILGPEQSGHISAVGYEMYCQLLDVAVRKLRGEPIELLPETHLELGVGGYLPKAYVPSDRQRMEVYRRVSHCRTDDDLTQLEADLTDSYGLPPEPVRTMLDLTQLRMWAAGYAIRTILAQPPDLVFTVENMKRFKAITGRATGPVRVIDDETVHIRLTPAYFEPATLMATLRRLLRPTPPATAGK
ncbi:MAG: transcription-repair coupling factor [Phycisphaerae bacterium]|nr:transcription-repair coupling factor [Phycisphaerae bacterium]